MSGQETTEQRTVIRVKGWSGNRKAVMATDKKKKKKNLVRKIQMSTIKSHQIKCGSPSLDYVSLLP